MISKKLLKKIWECNFLCPFLKCVLGLPNPDVAIFFLRKDGIQQNMVNNAGHVGAKINRATPTTHYATKKYIGQSILISIYSQKCKIQDVRLTTILDIGLWSKSIVYLPNPFSAHA
jgi:hypothetical protein